MGALTLGGSGDEWNYIRELSNVTMNRCDEDGNQEGSGQVPVPLTTCDLNTASTPTTVSSAVSLQFLSTPSAVMDEPKESGHCHVCNKMQPYSAFVMLPCKHGFCNQCTSIISQTQLCPLCLSSAAVGGLQSSLSSITASPSPLFPGTSSHSGDVTATNLSLDSSFSIWDPLSPKSLIKHELQRSMVQTSVQQRTKLFHSSQQLSDTSATHSLLDPSLLAFQSGAAAAAGLFSLPPQPLTTTSTINWHTVPSAEIQQTFSDNAVATVRCMQCDETLCNECVVAHYRMRVTREHKVVRIEAFKGLPLSQLYTTREPIKFENLLETETCNTHDSPVICTCITCGSASLCNICITDHSKHQLVPYGELRTSLLTLIASSKHDQKNLEDALETVRRMLERVDASVQSAIRELRSAIHLHISALEERKRDLLQRVDTIRQTKISTLKAQGERLGQRHTVLTEALKAAEIVTAVGEGMEIQQRSSFDALLSILREPCLYLVPNETDLIKFIPPDNTFISKLRSLGELESGACARTTHIIGEGYKRAIRDRLCTILVQTRDACGDACTSTSHQVSASLLSPEGRALDIRIAEQDGGIYSLTYFPIDEGNHFLDIKIRGVSICGCPTVIYARKGRNYGTIARTGPLFSFGSEGSADGQFCRPWGICCDNKGRIIVADRSNNRVQIFDKEGNFLHKFGSPGTRPGQFDRPAGITNEIVVADKDNHRVQVFSERGDFLLKFGERGRTPGLFNYPWGVAVNSFNQIAVSDTRNHRVQMFSPQGHFIRKFGFDNSLYNYKNLDSPRGVCFLHDGQLVITDFNNHRLVVMSSRGTVDMKMYGSEGDNEGSFCRPQGITTDNEEHILVCDSRNNRIQVLSLDGMQCVASFGGVVPGLPGDTGSRADGESAITPLANMSAAHTTVKTSSSPQLSTSTNASQLSSLDRPTDLCVSPDGLIYVVDFGSSCIRVY
ncbi:B-box zinc finger family protein [Loa loa]|uniref:B-box zinc finger family protein n=1 Tax=Loa loa TaxID=7209 RepID=A0A1S0ULM7_LOALO|nr:B-box zinc finger family protein [Loa loa]EJD76381.1 B-box zinc finger family protein [Loa loa]